MSTQGNPEDLTESVLRNTGIRLFFSFYTEGETDKPKDKADDRDKEKEN